MYRELCVTSKYINETAIITELIQIDLFAETISQKIRQYYEKSIIRDSIDENYFYFLLPEQMFIEEQTLLQMQNPSMDFITDYIKYKLIVFFEENNTLDLEGFITFRLVKYKELLEQILEDVISEYLYKLEYDEFMEGLKLYVNIQTPMIDTIQLIADETQYVILNEQDEEIMIIKLIDDLLINTLITIAPKQIFLYGTIKNEKIEKTITKIFENKLLKKQNIHQPATHSFR